MIAPEIPVDEGIRLASLRRLDLLDTGPEESFDRITRLAQRLFRVPVALVSLVDGDRQWFKSNRGFDASETPRDVSFCGHAINGTEVMVVPDATDDPRFADNPLVLGGPRIRFYAGCPIAAPDGSRIGTLCVCDSEPRHLDPEDIVALTDLAALVEQELAVRQLAIDDELTGLHNRRGFHSVARQGLALCRRQWSPALVLFVDVDGLKRVNDTLGHDAGDQLIREAAEVIKASLREADVVARLGGDEFAAFLTGYEADPSVAVDRLVAAVDARNAEVVSAPFRLSFSVGAAAFDPLNPETLDELIHRADEAMYVMKQTRYAAGGGREQRAAH